MGAGHVAMVMVVMASLFGSLTQAADNPCCSFPCLNRGVCLTGKTPGTYTCDCANLDFYGKNCENPFFLKRIKLMIKPDPGTIHWLLVTPYFKWLWDIVNSIEFVHDFFMKTVYIMRADILDTPPLYETVHGYTTIATTTNATLYSRTLPPVPLNCPTPMGVKGKKDLPDIDDLINKFFVRKKFRPDPMGTSIMFTYFAQHFTHMFFKTDISKGGGHTWSGHGVDVTSIYGTTVSDENRLRSFKDGKLKMQILNDETYPMYQKDAPVNMTYMPNTPNHSRFAMGHPFFGLLPGLFLYETIWMREHNRVCGVLREEHPDWEDEQLFQTAKLIILGETIKIVVEDYVQHLARYNIKLRFRPPVLFGQSFQYSNKIAVEFNHLYHWHPLMPDEFYVQDKTYSMKEYVFHADLVVKHGTSVFTEALSNQRAGQMSHHNHGVYTVKVLKDTILHGRELRMQSFNNYRIRFGIKPYKSFEELTGEKEMAAVLEKLYGDVDAVEFYVGILIEKRQTKNLFGQTVVEIGGPYSVKGLMANPICSPYYWRPSTFGGDVGFNIVKDATLESLFCANIPGPCPRVSFSVPNFTEGDIDDKNNYEGQVKDEL